LQIPLDFRDPDQLDQMKRFVISTEERGGIGLVLPGFYFDAMQKQQTLVRQSMDTTVSFKTLKEAV
jgi:hypothetical protein